MLEILRRAGVGLLCGVIVGAVVFVSVSVVEFGIGWCSPAGIWTGLQFGAIAGAVLGPLIAALRLGRWKAAVWGLFLVSAAWLVFLGVGQAQRGATFDSIRDGLGWMGRALLVMAISGTLGGAAIAWAMGRVAEWGVPGVAGAGRQWIRR